MHSLKFLILVLAVLCFQTTYAQQSDCLEKSNFGEIADKQVVQRRIKYTKCWTVKVPSEHVAEITVTTLRVNRTPNTNVYLQIGSLNLKPPQTGNKVTATKDVTITFYAENIQNTQSVTAEFKLSFKVGDVGGNAIAGLKESRDKTIKLLEDRRFNTGGWRENTQKAVIAIHLAKGTNFNENCEVKLMASQVETRVAITAKSTENDVLGDNINALVAICADPVNFYGETLVSRIRAKTDLTKNDGLAYLALCIGGETLTAEDLPNITDILEGADTEKKYYRAMALACALDRQNPAEKETLEANFKTAVRTFMQFQMLDGSFMGGVKASAMYVQMLLASKQTKHRQWNYENAVKYLMREMERSPDLDSILLTLPILNGKTMADIMCMSNEGAADMRENESMKTITLRYEDIKMFSVTMKVKENITAMQFIQVAEKQEPNLRFRSRQVEDGMNVYEITGIRDDLIIGKHWQFYSVKSSKNNATNFIAEEAGYAETKLEEGLDEFTMTDVKELILWYKELEETHEENAK